MTAVVNDDDGEDGQPVENENRGDEEEEWKEEGAYRWADKFIITLMH